MWISKMLKSGGRNIIQTARHWLFFLTQDEDVVWLILTVVQEQEIPIFVNIPLIEKTQAFSINSVWIVI